MRDFAVSTAAARCSVNQWSSRMRRYHMYHELRKPCAATGQVESGVTPGGTNARKGRRIHSRDIVCVISGRTFGRVGPAEGIQILLKSIVTRVLLRWASLAPTRLTNVSSCQQYES